MYLEDKIASFLKIKQAGMNVLVRCQTHLIDDEYIRPEWKKYASILLNLEDPDVHLGGFSCFIEGFNMYVPWEAVESIEMLERENDQPVRKLTKLPKGWSVIDGGKCKSASAGV